MKTQKLLLLAASLLSLASAGSADVLVPMSSEWRYWDQENVGSNWFSTAFAADAWPSGKGRLGYGEGSEATVLKFGEDPEHKRMACYFRREFDVADPKKYTTLKLRVVRDDGVVVYVNGREAWRNNMPEGAVKPETRAVKAVSGEDEKRPIEAVVAAKYLVPGRNVVAVEVHQSSGNSSDLGFDFQLDALDEPVISRGPYLQNGTPQSVVLKWRTLGKVSSRVRYGTDPRKLTQVVDLPAETADHEVELKNLSPNTRYFYEVGHAKAWFPRAADFAFTTSPEPGTAKPTRIWVLGDSGTANQNARAVRDAYYKFTAGRATDLWLMLGDNAYSSGTDDQYQAAVFDMYSTMLHQSVLWSVLGNHETYNGLPTYPYFDIFTLPTKGEAGGVPSGTESYYSFDYGNIHFIGLDSMVSDRSKSGPMATWLEKDLAATKQDWIIALWHHPPYTKGSHNSDLEIELVEMRSNIVPILEDGGVDIVLTGHSHCYERSFLIDGHYGMSGSFNDMMKKDGGDGREDGKGVYKKQLKHPGHQGAVYMVAGSSGQISNGTFDHPAMFVSLKVLGSMVLDVKGNRLDAIFLNNKGEKDDHFSIVKSGGDTTSAK